MDNVISKATVMDTDKIKNALDVDVLEEAWTAL